MRSLEQSDPWRQKAEVGPGAASAEMGVYVVGTVWGFQDERGSGDR